MVHHQKKVCLPNFVYPGGSIEFLLFLELQKSLLASFQGCWMQWQRFESSSIHHFWDTQKHSLKTHFFLESGFLSFLELQKSILVSFHGCWTQWWQLWRFHCLYLGLLKRYMRKCSFSSVKLSQFLQYLSQYAFLSSSWFTKLNKAVWTWKDEWFPWRTSTYKRPFNWDVTIYLPFLNTRCQ